MGADDGETERQRPERRADTVIEKGDRIGDSDRCRFVDRVVPAIVPQIGQVEVEHVHQREHRQHWKEDLDGRGRKEKPEPIGHLQEIAASNSRDAVDYRQRNQVQHRIERGRAAGIGFETRERQRRELQRGPMPDVDRQVEIHQADGVERRKNRYWRGDRRSANGECGDEGIDQQAQQGEVEDHRCSRQNPKVPDMKSNGFDPQRIVHHARERFKLLSAPLRFG